MEAPTHRRLFVRRRTVAALARLGRAGTAALVAGVLWSPAPGPAQEQYRTPPQAVVDILDAPQAPMVTVSPDRRALVLVHRKNMPTIEDLAQPMLRLAGRRINPATNGWFSPSLVTGLSVMQVADGSERALELPPGGGWDSPTFAPDGSRFAFTRTTAGGIELWIADASGANPRQLVGPRLNGARGTPCAWLPDSRALLCHLVPEGRGAPPREPEVPGGPVIQESAGRTAPVRTYQDLLEDPHDVALYDYYMTSQPTLVAVETGALSPLGGAANYASLEPSPSGRYFLVERRVEPYSYLVPDRLFPMEVEVWDAEGRVVQRLADVPLGEAIPIGGVATGPRDHRWLTGNPHTVLYVEALDGGDPRAEAARRDRVHLLEVPFDGEPATLIETEFRYAGLMRGAGGFALLSEYDRPSRALRTWRVDLDRPAGGATVLWERNSEDRYADPGRPLMRTNARGEEVMIQRGDWIYLEGPGASDEGDRPFLDRLNVKNGRSERLFQSSADSYEEVVAVVDDEARRAITRYETRTEPPNYYVRDLRSNRRTALTSFPDPAPQLAGLERQFVVYQRADGVQLSGDLYLPAGFEEGQPLPTLVWAYPREYSNPDVAGQVRGSPNRFPRIFGPSHLLFLTQGYAVFDGPAMPIVGGDTANDTYVEQLVASAQAAVDKLVEMGVADRDRIGVGGHSYGAFMTANLLAHSDLFRAGIARSGAYNRSLTPFGFQNERRTFWEASDVYFRMSPFMNAEKIDEPMLMIHGVADNNSGTFPVQSERMYHAIKGLGGAARLVMLPHESHGYRARESVLHAVAEMIEWMDRYVKNAPPRSVTQQPEAPVER